MCPPINQIELLNRECTRLVIEMCKYPAHSPEWIEAQMHWHNAEMQLDAMKKESTINAASTTI